MPTLFALPKKSLSTEANLRAWALEDAILFMGQSDRAGIAAHYWRKDIKDLAAGTASLCVAELERDKRQLRLFGNEPGMKDTWRFSQGIELVRDLVKKNGWRISFENDPERGSRCIIE
jgi:hypothetical protein